MTILLTIFMVAVCAAQDEVTLTVTGSGATKEEAVNNALRSAVAQTYGVFVSANTQLLNDSLVKDEVATVTSGNIKEYKEIASLNLPNNLIEVTLQTTVSVSKLVSYAQSKGATAELSGATFAKNLKMRQFNQDNELKAISNFLGILPELLPTCYDRKLIVSEPTMDGNDVQVPMKIEYIPNENLDNVINTFENIIKSLSLSKDEVKEYQDLKTPVYAFYFVTEGNKLLNPGTTDYNPSAGIFLLRNNYSRIRSVLREIFDDYFLNFTISDNTGQKSVYTGSWSKEYEGSNTWPFLSSDLDRVIDKNATGLFSALEINEGPYHKDYSMKISDIPFAMSSWFEINLGNTKKKKSFGKLLKAAIGDNVVSDGLMQSSAGNVIYGGDGTELFWERQKGYPFELRQKYYVGDFSSPSNNTVQGRKNTVVPSVSFTILIPSSEIGKYSKFTLD